MKSSSTEITRSKVRPAPFSQRSVTGASGPVIVELDRAHAIARALADAAPGDVVLIAGKGHEQGQERDGVVLPFDDRLVAREALA